MGQQEVYDLLKKYKKQWLNASEIAKLMNASFNNVTSNLRRLRQAGVIMCKGVVRVVKPAGETLRWESARGYFFLSLNKNFINQGI